MTPTDDEILMRQVRDGYTEKLDILFERHRRPLLKFLSRTVSDRTVAEDLVQDVFYAILTSSGTFRDDSRFKPWMYQIARNACARHFAGQPPESESIGEDDDALPQSPGPLPGEELELEQKIALLNRAMLKLPPEKRELLLLHRYQEMTYEEIARAWGCGSAAVRVRAFRAVKDLGAIYLKSLNEKPSCNVKKFRKTSSSI